jgi:beta-lactamase class C
LFEGVGRMRVGDLEDHMNWLSRCAAITGLVLVGAFALQGCERSSPGGSTRPGVTSAHGPQTTSTLPTAPTATSTPQPGAPAPCPPELVSRVNKLVAQYLESSKALGVSASLYDNGRTCLFAAGEGGGKSGKVTPDTIFAMGSVQKVFSSTMLAYQIVQGHASLDDLATKYLVAGDGSTVSPQSAFSKVTLANLASHSSSLPDGTGHATERVGSSLWRDQPMPPSLVAFLDAWQPEVPIGTRYGYSNLGYVLVGHATAKLAGKPYSQILQDVVTGPLGMPHTGRALCDPPRPDPNCAEAHESRRGTFPVGLWTTATDLGRFLQAHLGVIPLPDLQAKAFALTHRELFRASPEHATAMGWELMHSGDALQITKNGEDSGFQSWVAFEPGHHRAIAILTSGAKMEPKRLGLEMLDATNSSR